MSKNLGNIPSQESMSESQEQTFTNGINKGRKLEREMLVGLIMEHKSVPSEVCGYASMCSCGDPYDDYRLHILGKIKGLGA